MKKIIIILIVAYFASYLYFGGFLMGYKNNHFIVYTYTCADVCPQQGSWYKKYYGNISLEQCLSIGGEPKLVGFISFDNPIGGYDGCRVK